jgi:ATP-dependent Lon protease
MKILKMPDGSTTAILQGRKRFEALDFDYVDKIIVVRIKLLEDLIPLKDMKFNATMSSLRDYAKKIIELSPQIPSEANFMLQNIKNNGFLINFIASNMNIGVDKKQEILEMELLEK